MIPFRLSDFGELLSCKRLTVTSSANSFYPMTKMERKTQNWPAGCLEEHLLTLRVLHRERAQLAEGEMDVAGRGCGSTWTLDWLTPKALHSPFLHAALSHSSEGKKSSNLCLPGSSECVTNYLQEAEEAMVSLPFPDTATLPQVHTVFMETVAVRHSLAQSCLILFDPMDYIQHARLHWLSLLPRVRSNSCPSNRWCHPAISSSLVPFSSCLQSFPASGSFPVS